MYFFKTLIMQIHLLQWRNGNFQHLNKKHVNIPHTINALDKILFFNKEKMA